MKIWSYVPKDGPGVTDTWVLQKCPDLTATLSDIQTALKWAERDGKLCRIGSYYWRRQ